VEAAREDLKQQWAALRSAAIGRFDGGGGGGGGGGAADGVPAVMAERARRFGQGGPPSSGDGNRPLEVVEPAAVDPWAAAQEAGASVAAGTAAAQPKAAAGADGTDVGAAGTNAPGGPEDQQQQQPQPQQPQQRRQQGQGADEAKRDVARLLNGEVAPWETPVTSVAAFAVIGVALAQWWPLLGDVWWGLTHGLAADTLWQLASAIPDTPPTRALQLVCTMPRGRFRLVLRAAAVKRVTHLVAQDRPTPCPVRRP
jgi:hypothetical protein